MPSCNDCNKGFDTKRQLYKHVRLVHKKDPIPRNSECGHCHQIFTRLNNLSRHLRSIHKFSSNFQCRVCSQVFGSQSSLKNHNDFFYLELEKKDVHSAPFKTPVLLLHENPAINSHFQIFRIALAEDFVDPFAFLLDNKDHLKNFLVETIQGQGHSRAGLCVQVQLMTPLDQQSVTPYSVLQFSPIACCWHNWWWWLVWNYWASILPNQYNLQRWIWMGSAEAD